MWFDFFKDNMKYVINTMTIIKIIINLKNMYDQYLIHNTGSLRINV